MISFIIISIRKFICSTVQDMLLRRETIVRKLKKAIYKLKQHPQVRFEKFAIVIVGIGF